MKRILVLIFVLIKVGVMFPEVNAQTPYIRQHDFEFDYHSQRVNRLFTDKYGFLWMASQSGLFRYDGMNQDYFPFPDSLFDQQISAIGNGIGMNLWIGTDKGNLYQLEDNRRLVKVNFSNKLTLPVTSILTDFKKQTWIGTAGGGLVVVNSIDTLPATSRDGLPDPYINSMLVDAKGNVWVATDNGLAICNTNSGKLSIKIPPGNQLLPDVMITCLALARDGSILAGTVSAGVIRIKNVKGEFDLSLSEAWDAGYVIAIEAKGDQFWVATEDKGVLVCESGKKRKELSLGTLGLKQRIQSIAKDLEGNIWIADKSEKVVCVNDLFSFINISENLGEIQSLAVSHASLTWIGTTRGTWCVENGLFVKLPQQISSVKPVCILSDSCGWVWLGTLGNGAIAYNPLTKQVKTITETEGLINNNVISICRRGDEIWLSTLAGIAVYRFVNGKISPSFSGKNIGLPSGYFYQIFKDSKNNIWFASDGYGLYCYMGRYVRNFGRKDGLTGEVISNITEDEAGNLWFNSPDAGLFRFDGRRFKLFSTRDGLREQGFSLLAAGSNDNLIVLNSKGIDVVNTVSFNFLYHDKEIEFGNFGVKNKAVCRDNSGKVWIGVANRLLIYDPAYNYLWNGPKPLIKQVIVNGSLIDTTDNKFAYFNNDLTFDYIGIWYHNPEEVNYLVKLEGYDSDWVRSKNTRAAYQNLPPGNYTFRIKALASNHFTTNLEAEYKFEIEKPFYLTYWFLSAAITAISLFIWLIYKQRISKIEEQQKAAHEKIRFQYETLRNQVNPHFLFNSFNTLSAIIETNPEEAIEYVEQLSDFFRNILRYKDKDMIQLKEELDLLNHFVQIQKKRYGNNLFVDIAEEVYQSELFIAPMTLQILVENAIKHNVVSSADPLRISISLTEDGYIRVLNFLKPKTDPEQSTKTGLANIKSRYDILSEKHVEVFSDNKMFYVDIPLLSYGKNSDN